MGFKRLNQIGMVAQQEQEQRLAYVRNLQEVFSEFDVDGSGTISLEEFERVMGDIKVQRSHVTRLGIL